MRPILILLLLSLTGCSSLKSKVFNEVQYGDPQQKVITKLGEPDSFNGQSLIYRSKKHICEIGIENNNVVSTSCEDNPSYVSGWQVFGHVLSGMGDGLSHAQTTPWHNTSVNCLTNTNGYSSLTSCN